MCIGPLRGGGWGCGSGSDTHRLWFLLLVPIKMMCHCACAMSSHWNGILWRNQGGWPHNSEAAPLSLLFPGWFSIVELILCSGLLALWGLPCVNSTIMSRQLVGLCFLTQNWVPGSRLQGAPAGALWIHTLVPSTGGVSAVVWLGWGAGIYGLRLSCILTLRYLVVVSCSSTSILFRIIVPLSSLGLPHIFLAGLRWGGPRLFYVCIWYQSCPILA